MNYLTNGGLETKIEYWISGMKDIRLIEGPPDLHSHNRSKRYHAE